jgi:hypothetical protein
MKAQITFGNCDIHLASAIRGLANAIEGYQIVKGQTNLIMRLTDSLDFDFKSEEQAKRFERAVRKYIAIEFQKDIQIELISPILTIAEDSTT